MSVLLRALRASLKQLLNKNLLLKKKGLIRKLTIDCQRGKETSLFYNKVTSEDERRPM